MHSSAWISFHYFQTVVICNQHIIHTLLMISLYIYWILQTAAIQTIAYYKSRAIAWRTARCRYKFRYVSNFTAVSCCFSATARLSCTPFKCWNYRQYVHVGVNLSRYLKLFGREVIFEVFQPVWKTYLNVTDRQTNSRTDWRRTVANCALRSIARLKYSIKMQC